MRYLEGIGGPNLAKAIVDKAVEAALKSRHKYKHGAIIFKGKRIYSIGINDPSRSVRSLNYNIATNYKTSIHAEVACILNAKRNVTNMDILVVRLNAKKQFALSKPCNRCLDYLEYCGIKNIYYSVMEYPFIVKL